MLIDACIEIVGLREDNLNVEFTQHDGDEMYHTLYGGLSEDWKAGEPDRLGSWHTGQARSRRSRWIGSFRIGDSRSRGSILKSRGKFGG